MLFNSICPNCSSRKRHRGLYELYRNILDEFNSPKILHFAPEPVFYRIFKNLEYSTSDLFLNDVDLKLDIQNINLRSDTFDLILCNHVLEHIPDDRKAMRELARILKPKGLAILTIPGIWRRKLTWSFGH